MKGSLCQWVTLPVVSVLLLAACAAPAVQAPMPAAAPASQVTPSPVTSPGAWDKVLEAAKKEGSITIYSTLGIALGEAMKAAMAQRGIKAEIVAGSAADVLGRVATEQRTQTHIADVFVSGYPSLMSLMEAGSTSPVTAPLPALQQTGVWRIHPSKFEPTGNIISFGTSITPSVIVNKDLVRQGEIRSWNDLTDSKWRDKIAMSDSRAGPGPGTSGLGAFMTLGEDFWKKIAAQRPVLHTSTDLPVSQVALGEKALGIFPALSRTVTAIRAGAPIQIVHLQEGTSYAVNAASILKNAPHPNVALVLIDWMVSQEGQAAISRATDNYCMRSDITETWLRIPELNLGTFALLEPPNNTDPTVQARAREFGIKVFGPR